MKELHPIWEELSQVSSFKLLKEALGEIDDNLDQAPSGLGRVLDKPLNDKRVSRDEALSLIGLEGDDLVQLLMASSYLRNEGRGKTLTFSKNVFVPVTQLCRNHCGYCTFKYEPHEGRLFIPPDEVVELAKKGASLGCTELLFVTGDKPELVYREYREALRSIGYETTAEYLIALGELGLKQNIFPHTNLGLATRDELIGFSKSNPSMGLMLENISPRLLNKGEAHYRCPDKVPKQRMSTMDLAGELNIPWTSGILVGIGETWEERIDSLLALRELNDKYGNLQEIIIQNFTPTSGIRMADTPAPELVDMLRLVAISRIIFGGAMNIQIPPNLNPESYPLFIYAGINDLGGVSPITIDYVNPESPWPQLDLMAEYVNEAGFQLRERLPVYPEYISDEYINPDLLEIVLNFVDQEGYVPTEVNEEV